MNKAMTICTITLLSLSLTACGTNNKSSDSNNSAASTSASTKKKYYKMGDIVKVGKVTYTLKSAKVTGDRNESATEQPKHVIKVIYHVKNNSAKDLPVENAITAYEPDKTKLKEYQFLDTNLNYVAKGKEADIIVNFSSDKLGTFEFDVSPLIFTEKTVKFRVKVKADSSVEETSSSLNSSSAALQSSSQQSTQKTNATSSSATAASSSQASSIPSEYYDEEAYKDTCKANMTPEQRYRWDSAEAERGAQLNRELGLEP